MRQDRPGFPQRGVFADLRDPRLMFLKAWLFLLSGCLAVAGLLLAHPNLSDTFLLAVAIWSFCRLYYFMFYVIEHYVDGRYRFAGVAHFLVFLVRRSPAREAEFGGTTAETRTRDCAIPRTDGIDPAG